MSEFTYRTQLDLTVDSVDYRLATDEWYDGGAGEWYEDVLGADVGFAERFIAAGLNSGSSVMVTVLYRADSDAVGLFNQFRSGLFITGVAAKLTVVQTDIYGVQTTKARWLTVNAISARPGEMVLELADTSDESFNALYPATTWNQGGDFPDMLQGGAEAPIPYAVGTALKLPGRLISDAGGVNYPSKLFALCEAPTSEHSISAVDHTTDTITVTGDITDLIDAGDQFLVTVAFGVEHTQDGFTAASVTLNAGNTEIVTNEDITASAAAAGSVVLMPQVLAVYRNGRLVDSSEYHVCLIDSPSAENQFTVTDFSAATDWNTAGVGTGTATIASGKLTLTGDGGKTNYGACQFTGGGVLSGFALRHQPVMIKVVVLTGYVSLYDFLPTVPRPITVGPGTHYIPVSRARSPINWTFTISNYNTGFSANAEVDSVEIHRLSGLSGSEKPTPPRHLAIWFDREQIDHGGNRYLIEADVLNRIDSRNVATEIDRILGIAGYSIEAANLATAEAYAENHKMDVDCDYGRDGQKRTLRAILDDLEFVARGNRRRSASSATEYELIQDKDAAASQSFDEDLGDPLEIEAYNAEPKPSSVSITYRPSGINPAELLHTVERTVAGGTLGPERPRAIRYVRDHETADRLLSYLAKRQEYAAETQGTLMGVSIESGEILSLESVNVLPVGKKWRVKEADFESYVVSFSAVEQELAVETYVPGTLPSDAEEGYQPDYSETPPEAPTALTISAEAINVATATGESVSSVTVHCTPPTVNWSEIRLFLIHNVTNEIPAMVTASDNGDGTYGATLTGMRPGEVYRVNAYAMNAFGELGSAQTTFDATAIGGTASDTTFTSAGTPSAPPNVTGIARNQGPGRTIEVSWSGVTASNLRSYVLERQIGAGSFVQVWEGQATSYIDRNVSYGTAYSYRVKAKNSALVVSGSWNTSSSLTINGNLVGGATGTADLAQDTVTQDNRTALSTSSSSATIALAAASVTKAISHGFAKAPSVNAWATSWGGSDHVWLTLEKVNTSEFQVRLQRAYQSGITNNAYRSATSLVNFTAQYQ